MSKKTDTQREEELKKNPLLKPDKGTEHTTDPQENMKGPLSSIVQGVKEKGEENDKESKEESDKKKDRNT